MQRVIVYIDGFNLYFGMKSKGWKRYYWLDLKKLAQSFVKPGRELVLTKYFTARISASSPAKEERQKIYLEAVETLADLKIFYGHYLEKTVKCFKCGNIWRTFEEKMTDVSISTELLTDAFNDHFDIAIIVSGDSDLAPPISAITKSFPLKEIIVAFPPGRVSMRLKHTAHTYFHIGGDKLRQSMFPDQVVKPGGITLHRPPEWARNVKGAP